VQLLSFSPRYMKSSEIIIAQPRNNQELNALKAFMKALNIPFESAVENSNYNPGFVAKILNSKQFVTEGRFKTVEKNELKDLLGLNE